VPKNDIFIFSNEAILNNSTEPFENPQINKVPLVSMVSLDLAFAKVGSWMMILKSFLSFFISDDDSANSRKPSFLKVIDDLALKVRQQCQYSIHAQPGLNLRKPDDIAGDIVHNMQSARLGSAVYKYNAFVGPWLSILKIFFPYSNNLVFGLIPRMIDFADSSIMKLTNIFWNLRRITKSLIPYDGGISSQELLKKQSDVRQLMGFYWRSLIINPYNTVLKYLLKDKARDFVIPLSQTNFYDRYQIRAIQTKTFDDYFSNFKPLFSKKYFSVHEGKNINLGEEEPENSKFYIRSKILSQILGLWSGSIGAVLNTASIATGFVANLTNSRSIKNFSEGLTNQANALMSLVYLTGEVPANINEFFKKRKAGVSNRHYNLLVAGIGTLGMLNRIKLNPIISYIFDAIRLKPFLDRWDKLFKNFFLLFFSANRWVLHYDEKISAERTSSNQDVEISKKHDKLSKHISLPFRVLIGDPDVVYTNDEILQKANSTDRPYL
jgi:hypothetical protein